MIYRSYFFFITCLLTDDVALHRPQRSKKLVLLGRTNVEFVQRFYEIFNQCVEVGLSNPHSFMSRFHVFAGVFAWPTRHLTNLIDEIRLKLCYPLWIFCGVGKEFVNPGVGCTVANELIDDSSYSFLPAQPGEERLSLHFLSGSDAHTTRDYCDRDCDYHQTLSHDLALLSWFN